MSDDSGNGGFVLLWLSGRYAEVHISWEIIQFIRVSAILLENQNIILNLSAFYPQLSAS
jgi:hypothetical protein